MRAADRKQGIKAWPYNIDRVCYIIRCLVAIYFSVVICEVMMSNLLGNLYV